MYCKNCGKPMDDVAAVCVNCGAPKNAGNNFCPNCGAQTAPGAAFCLSCGVALNPQAAAAATGRAERKDCCRSFGNFPWLARNSQLLSWL